MSETLTERLESISTHGNGYAEAARDALATIATQAAQIEALVNHLSGATNALDDLAHGRGLLMPIEQIVTQARAALAAVGTKRSRDNASEA